jgi:hypothetical protein
MKTLGPKPARVVLVKKKDVSPGICLFSDISSVIRIRVSHHATAHGTVNIISISHAMGE